jgi:transposase
MVMLPATCNGCAQRDRIIARLQRQITQLQSRVANLEDENQRLRQQLDEAQRQAHRQTAPFRRRNLQSRPKKPGRHKGHPAANRPTPPPERIDRIIEVPCPRCPDCQTDLVDPGVVVQYQTDLPPIVPIVTQFNIETGYCPCCRRYCQGRHPEQVSDAIGAAGNTLGPVVLTMAAEMKHRLGVPYRKICDFFSTYCDLTVCPATLVRAEQRLTDLALPTYDLLLEALRQAEVVHADETGWRIGRLNAWLWVFSNQEATVYAIRQSRGHEVPEAILGPDFDGWLIVDGLASYTVLEYAKGQCNGHLLRRAKNLRDQVPQGEVPLLDELSHLLQEGIDLAQRRNDLTETGYRRRVAELENRLAAWVMARPMECSDDLRRLHRHLCNHILEWFVFLHEPAVPPTNNHAERMLRPAVITRKVGGCNKSLWGGLVHSVLASIMVTCKQQGLKFLELARQLWQSGEPQAVPLVPPPEP